MNGESRPAFPTDRKILPRNEARKTVEAYQREGKTVVFANGCFDVLHVGHVRFLEGAAAMGDVLVVGLNTDDSIRRIKGEGRPLESERERASLVAALRAVDRVVLFDEDTADAILEEIRPDVHAKGTDYTETNVPERGTSTRLGIRIAIVGDPKDHSTRDMIRSVRNKKS